MSFHLWRLTAAAASAVSRSRRTNNINTSVFFDGANPPVTSGFTGGRGRVGAGRRLGAEPGALLAVRGHGVGTARSPLALELLARSAQHALPQRDPVQLAQLAALALGQGFKSGAGALEAGAVDGREGLLSVDPARRQLLEALGVP
ncbi:hypothetical protein ACWDWS_38755 [Streptomyces sp. NPDC003328]